MPDLMKAAVLRAFNQPLQIEQMPVPVPGPGDVVVRIEASGVCHTDLHAARGDWPVKPKLPLVPGHEGVGRVARIGPGVTHLKEGDAVGIPWLYDACGYCHYCTSGWESLCERQRNTGYSVHGAYAEYVLARGGYVGLLPEKADLAALAPILCAGVTAYKGLKETEARAGEWVAISGIGGLGHVAVQYAKAMGLHVAALDVDPSKLALASRLGADIAVDSSDPRSLRRLVRRTGGMHGVLVTAVATAAFTHSAEILRRKGTMVLVGLPPGDFRTPIFPLVLKRITIRGSIVGTRQDLRESLAFATEGKVQAQIAIEPMENVNDVLHRLEMGRVEGRVVLIP